MRRSLLLIGLALLLVMATAGPSTAGDDWTNLSGTSGGARANPSEWQVTTRSAGTVQPAWQHIVGCCDMEPALIDGDTVFAAGGQGELSTTPEQVLALAIDTGAVRWHRTFEHPGTVSGIALADDVLIVAVWGEGFDRVSSLYALDRETGDVVWRHGGPPPMTFNLPGTVGGGRVYWAFGTSFRALDASTGELLWSVDGADVGNQGREWVTYANERIYLHDSPGTQVWSAVTGERLHRLYSGQGGMSTGHPAVVADGAAFQIVASADTTWLERYPLQCSTDVCRPSWRAVLPSGSHAPAVSGGRAFVATFGAGGRVAAFDSSTGRALWLGPLSRGYNGFVSVAADVVYAYDQDKRALEMYAAAGCGAPVCSPMRSLVLPREASELAEYTATVAQGLITLSTPGGGVLAYRADRPDRRVEHVVAATGTDHVPRVKIGAGPWQDLGGRLIGPPAVTTDAAGVYFAGESLTHRLYLRSLGQGWVQAGSARTSCRGASAAVHAGRLYVACRWVDGSTRVATAPVRSGVVGKLGRFRSYGAGTAKRPAIAFVDGTLTLAVRGSYNGRVWTRTATSGWRQVGGSCSSGPTLASGGGITALACRDTSRRLSFARDVGAGWGPWRSTSTRVGGGVGLVTDQAGRLTAYTPESGSIQRLDLDESVTSSVGGSYGPGGVSAAVRD